MAGQFIGPCPRQGHHTATSGRSEIIRTATVPCANAGPLRILSLGQATPHKGFAEFVRLAELARASGNAQMEFRAAGAVRQDTRDIDQSALSRRAGNRPLERRELLAELST